jgi:hypothetical protein
MPMFIRKDEIFEKKKYIKFSNTSNPSPEHSKITGQNTVQKQNAPLF